MNNTSFIDSDGHVIKSSMVDEHQLIKITEKTPVIQNIGKIVCGDTNSNILTFEINRYYDNVDLYSKNIKFIVNNKLGIFTEDAVNIQYNDELLRFSWILSDKVTVESGNINAAIVFMGIQENKDYALKTLPFTITIEKSLDFPDAEVEYTNWFVHIENEIADLRNSNFNPGTSDSHEHSNKSLLDKLSVSDDGKLLYDGKPIGSSGTSSGDKALSAYEIAVNEGFTGTVEEWLESLKGEPGRNGTDGLQGENGKSAYDIAIENGFSGTEAEWLESLKGEPGQDATLPDNHSHGDMIRITFSATEPDSIENGEIVMVYEE